jgi:hypothetical protein
MIPVNSINENIINMCKSIIQQYQYTHPTAVTKPEIPVQIHKYINPLTGNITLYQIKDDMLNGYYRKYNKEHNIISERFYQKNDLIYQFEYYKDGTPKMLITLNTDTNIYKEITYYEKSQTISSIYKFSRITGLYTEPPIEYTPIGITKRISITPFLRDY